MNTVSIVCTIERLISEYGISKTEFSEECGITIATMSMWRTGKNNISKNSLSRIAKFFDVTPESIIDGTAVCRKKEKPHGSEPSAELSEVLSRAIKYFELLPKPVQEAMADKIELEYRRLIEENKK